MNPPHYVLLSEATSVDDFVDDAMFTDVAKDGEIYTTYRIVRFTHEVQEHHEGWTHLANVTLVHSEGIAVAFLRVRNRIIEDSRIRTHSGDTGAS